MPVKWPKPPGVNEAAWCLNAVATQEITIELMSDGTRRVARDQT